MIEATVAGVTEQLRRPKEYVYQGTLDRQNTKIVRTLDRIAEATLGHTINIATITLGCALGYLDFRAPQLAWREGRGGLSRWYEAFSARKSMQATVPHT
jgi:glutathione S-transferase